MKDLIYISNFGSSPKNIWQCCVALKSILLFKPPNTDLLVYCDQGSRNRISSLVPEILKDVIFWMGYQEYASPIDESCWARYEIFKWPEINQYDLILYLDTDIIIGKPLEDLFVCFKNCRNNLHPICAKAEGRLMGQEQKPWHGKDIFDFYKKSSMVHERRGFSTGVLIFRNCEVLSHIFSKAQDFSRKFLFEYRALSSCDLHPFVRCDQPTINYLLLINSLVDVNWLDAYVVKNPATRGAGTVFHFAGGIGRSDKVVKMTQFLEGDHSFNEITRNWWFDYANLDRVFANYKYPSVERVGGKELVRGFLASAFGNTTSLFFVKVGANDGLTGDPFGAALVKDKAWRGLLIEPVRHCFDRLKENYNDQERFTVLRMAIDVEPGMAQFYYVDQAVSRDLPSLSSWVDQLGSFSRQHIINHLDGVLEPYIREEEVAVCTLSDVVSEYNINAITLLHVDTEGCDVRVLQSFDFSVAKPLVIFIEHNHLGPDGKAVLEGILFHEGYAIFDCGRDFFAFRRQECFDSLGWVPFPTDSQPFIT